VSVYNYAEDVDPPHKATEASLCARIVDGSRGKLKVAPCYVPSLFAGPYWVLAYNEGEGYALVSGGEPKKYGSGGCRTGSDNNGSGIWIFTRQKHRNQALVDNVRGIAASMGCEVSVLNDVVQA